MNRIRHTMQWWFTAPEEPVTTRRVIGWWELRRIPFNLIIGSVGLLALGIFITCIESAGVLQPGEDAVEPLALMIAPLLANLCYTGGWLVDVPLRLICPSLSSRMTPQLFILGLLFSLFVITFPALLWGGYRLLQLLNVLDMLR